MENIDPALIQKFLESNANKADGSSTQPFTLFPQELVDIFAMATIALTVISALFLIVYLIGTIRKWRVQSAVLDMHRDVKELKEHLAPQKPQTKIDRDTEKIA